jgi:hypothetical protein
LQKFRRFAEDASDRFVVHAQIIKPEACENTRLKFASGCSVSE